jgi:hypothetical protein
MTLDTLLILAEYFSHKREVEFALLIAEENTENRLILAVSFDEASLLIRPSAIREIDIARELGCLMSDKQVIVRSVQDSDSSIENSIYKTGRPVYCGNAEAYDTFMKKSPSKVFQNSGIKDGFWNSGKEWN